MRTWANFISHRTKWDISQRSRERYFTFYESKTFHFAQSKIKHLWRHSAAKSKICLAEQSSLAPLWVNSQTCFAWLSGRKTKIFARRLWQSHILFPSIPLTRERLAQVFELELAPRCMYSKCILKCATLHHTALKSMRIEKQNVIFEHFWFFINYFSKNYWQKENHLL